MPEEKTEKPLTLGETLKAIDTKYASEAPVKKVISTTPSKRGPKLAGRIKGLQGLRPGLGQQFSHNKPKQYEE